MTILPGAAAASDAARIKVVASFSIIGDLAANVGGGRVALTTLVGPDGDAHVYEPSPADVAAMAAADVVLVNGLELEGFMTRLVEASGTAAAVAVLSKGAQLLPAAGGDDHDGRDHGHSHSHDHGQAHSHGVHDPHAWQAVANARVYVRNIVAAFCAADAQGCAAYRANGEAYGARLDALDEEIRAIVATIPQSRRVVVTSHDAFAYFGHEYGLTFLGAEGVSTDAEASAADVAALIRRIRRDEASAVFVENISDPRLVEQIAREAGVAPGGKLYSDALSAAGGPAASYIDMMRHNARAIATAITGG